VQTAGCISLLGGRLSVLTLFALRRSIWKGGGGRRRKHRHVNVAAVLLWRYCISFFCYLRGACGADGAFAASSSAITMWCRYAAPGERKTAAARLEGAKRSRYNAACCCRAASPPAAPRGAAGGQSGGVAVRRARPNIRRRHAAPGRRRALRLGNSAPRTRLPLAGGKEVTACLCARPPSVTRCPFHVRC